MTDRPSGDPAWESPKSLGLPRLPAGAVGHAVPSGGGTPPSEPARPVARWVGWSPTSWRTSR